MRRPLASRDAEGGLCVAHAWSGSHPLSRHLGARVVGLARFGQRALSVLNVSEDESGAKDFVESDVDTLDIHGSMLHAGEFQGARKAGPSHLRKFMGGVLAGVDCGGLLRKNARALKYSMRGSSPRPMAHKTIALTTELRELASCVAVF